ncbi:hypothetical protein ACFLT2_10975 [Acidobacteriota bacterium]
MPLEAIILTQQRAEAIDAHVVKFVNFMGIQTKLLSIPDSKLNLDFLGQNIKDEPPCLMINANVLARIHSEKGQAENLKSFLNSRKAYVLVYNCLPEEAHKAALSNLTDEAVGSTTSLDESKYAFAITDKHRAICRQFSGLSFNTEKREKEFVFELESDAKNGISQLVTIDKKSTFVFTEKNGMKLFLLAGNKIVDIDAAVPHRIKIEEHFSGIVPILMFIKYVFKDRCWHSDMGYASCVLDDPLIKETYGFVNYKTLLQAMDQHNFFMNIAFIPWNYKKTRKEAAQFLASRPDRYRVCVHGYNHSLYEFEQTDPLELGMAIDLAESKMKAQEQATGLGFDRIMVFPQEIFSKNALLMLKRCNYLAAPASTIYPIENRDPVKISSLLNPAIVDYHSFPLLRRRNLKDGIHNYAFDLFMGRPVLLYLHQEDFNGTYKRLISNVQKINSLQNDIKWTAMSDIVRNLHLQRTIAEDAVEVKCYASECLVENTSAVPRKYLITKPENGDVALESVTANGKPIDYTINGGNLTLSTEILPGSQFELKITYWNESPGTVRKESRIKKFKVWSRRFVSEFRDQHLSKNRIFALIIKWRADRMFKAKKYGD